MKKSITILIITIMTATTTSGQTKTSKEAKLEAEIIALDKLAWDAWKNKDAEWFKVHTTEEFLSISSEGVSNKADVIKATPTECDVKSYALADFKFVVLDKNTVLLTYTATMKGKCGGKKLPSKIRASVNYVKRGGNWIEAFYMETTITQ